MSRLTRDGTAELVSRDQILRHARGQGNIIFPVQLTTSRIGNLTWLIHTLAICDDHTQIHTYPFRYGRKNTNSGFLKNRTHGFRTSKCTRLPSRLLGRRLRYCIPGILITALSWYHRYVRSCCSLGEEKIPTDQRFPNSTFK